MDDRSRPVAPNPPRYRVEHRAPDGGAVWLDANAERDLALEAAHAWSRLLGRRRGRGVVTLVDEFSGQVVHALAPITG